MVTTAQVAVALLRQEQTVLGITVVMVAMALLHQSQVLRSLMQAVAADGQEVLRLGLEDLVVAVMVEKALQQPVVMEGLLILGAEAEAVDLVAAQAAQAS
jgi:hypothetical protein